MDLDEIVKGVSRHVNLSSDTWCLSKWRADTVTFRPTHIIDDIEKMWKEIKNTDSKNRTVLPEQVVITDNVLLQIGMQESIDRDIGVSSTDNDWNSIGTSATAEDETHTDLQAEDSGGSYARKVFSTAGQRQRVNLTGKYGMLWDDGDISAAGLAIKESGIHWHLSDASKCHARVAFTTFTLNAGELFVVQINETHANGTL
jgi:hypothetical protein